MFSYLGTQQEAETGPKKNESAMLILRGNILVLLINRIELMSVTLLIYYPTSVRYKPIILFIRPPLFFFIYFNLYIQFGIGINFSVRLNQTIFLFFCTYCCCKFCMKLKHVATCIWNLGLIWLIYFAALPLLWDCDLNCCSCQV